MESGFGAAQFFQYRHAEFHFLWLRLRFATLGIFLSLASVALSHPTYILLSGFCSASPPKCIPFYSSLSIALSHRSVFFSSSSTALHHHGISFPHSPFAIRRSPFAIRHSPLITRHSSLATRHSPLVTRHSPLPQHLRLLFNPHEINAIRKN